MKIIDFSLIAVFVVLVVLSFTKVLLVFEYKRSFSHMDGVQEKIFYLQNQNTKLKLEIALIKSSPFIYEKALEIGMKEPEIVK
jgi:cell division protein FtsL|tara:strand:+ start:8608 stop:8856 length:249 start_codon:yes stop_codon:yes gene_type:complete